jgi:hypothetical protein
MRAFLLGDQTFNTKKALKEHVSNYLKCASLGPIPDIDKSWVHNLLHHHPRYNEKTAGIDDIQILIEKDLGWNHFSIRKENGANEDISYHKCLDQFRSSPRAHALAAFRYAIVDQTRAFREKIFQQHSIIVCPESGLTLRNDNNTHIDHDFRQLTFKTIVDTFLREAGMILETIQTEPAGPHGRSLRDGKLHGLFRQYHKDQAKLRAIHYTANLGSSADLR